MLPRGLSGITVEDVEKGKCLSEQGVKFAIWTLTPKNNFAGVG
jgi:hypothetical protein